ncbi:MAG: hypothetical protein V3V84_00575 [Candidatus Bathyarchaeia archaeon]
MSKEKIKLKNELQKELRTLLMKAKKNISELSQECFVGNIGLVIFYKPDIDKYIFRAINKKTKMIMAPLIFHKGLDEYIGNKNLREDTIATILNTFEKFEKLVGERKC